MRATDVRCFNCAKKTPSKFLLRVCIAQSWQTAPRRHSLSGSILAQNQYLKLMESCWLNVVVVGDGCPVHQLFVTILSAVAMKLTEMREDVALKNFSQCHPTVDFWRHVPESKYPEFQRPMYDSFLYLARHIAVNVCSL